MELFICIYLFIGFTYMIIQVHVITRMNVFTFLDLSAVIISLLVCVLFWPIVVFASKK